MKRSRDSHESPSYLEGLELARQVLDPAGLEALLEALARPLVPAIRINTLKTTVAEAQATWPHCYDWEIERVPYCPTGWRVLRAGRPLARTPEFKMGCYYIQDMASMLPAELFHLTGSEIVLDMAAAPGGKTTHLVSRLADRGLVIANDSSPGRIPPLRTNLQDWGATNTLVTNSLGELWGSWLPERFDRVLLDAPCSGQSLRTAERRRSRPISEKEREALQAQQIRLLVSGFQALKTGGELVYATCTLHPDENEAVLEALLDLYPGAAEIRPTEHLIQAPALLTDGERQFSLTIGRAIRLWPHLLDSSGFFAALIQKTQTVPVHASGYPARPLADRGFAPATGPETLELLGGLQDRYCFDLREVMESQGLALWKRDQQLFLLPELYLSHLYDLPMVAAGMLAAERKGKELVPSHELVSRFGGQFRAGRLTIPEPMAEAWLQGQELRNWSGDKIEHGSIVLVEDERGRILGRGKVLGARVRNLLPRRLVY